MGAVASQSLNPVFKELKMDCMTPDQLACLEQKRRDLTFVRDTLKKYRIKRGRHFTWVLDEVNEQLKFYDEWSAALEYDGMDLDHMNYLIPLPEAKP